MVVKMLILGNGHYDVSAIKLLEFGYLGFVYKRIAHVMTKMFFKG